MNDRFEAFEERNAEILTVSTDSIYTHRAWMKSTDTNGVGHFDLHLAADFSKEMAKNYDV